MFAAFEAALKQAAKDESDWNKTSAALYAEPPEVKRERLRQADKPQLVPTRGRMSVGDAEAMLARFAASDDRYG